MDVNKGKKVEATGAIEKLTFKFQREDNRGLSFKKVKEKKKKQKEESKEELYDTAQGNEVKNSNIEEIKEQMEMSQAGNIYRLKSILNYGGVEGTIKSLGEMINKKNIGKNRINDLYR